MEVAMRMATLIHWMDLSGAMYRTMLLHGLIHVRLFDVFSCVMYHILRGEIAILNEY